MIIEHKKDAQSIWSQNLVHEVLFDYKVVHNVYRLSLV